MTAIDHLSDPMAALVRLADQVRILQNTNPLAHASMSSGLVRILVNGSPVAAIGHASERAGLLLQSGGEWRTVQEYTANHVASALALPLARISDVEGRIGRVEPRMAAAEGDIAAVPGLIGAALVLPTNRITDVEGRVGRLEPRMASAESSAASQDSAISSLVGRVSNAESNIGAKANQSDFTTLAATVIRIMNRVNEQQLDLQALGRPARPPLSG